MPASFASLAVTLPPTHHLRAPDLAIIAAYLIAITLFGLKFRARNAGDRSLKNYFLAGNTIPWWAIGLSVVSAETSTLTIISIPGVAFTGNFGFLQVVLGYLLGRVVVAGLFLPRYFAGEMLTAYQLIARRFGPVLHKVTAGLFLLTRAAAEGVRVFAVSIVVSIAIGTGDIVSIGLITALTLLYTFEGGLAAVIWTDVVQMGIYVFGTLVALISLGHHVPGGWSTILQTAAAAGKLQTFNFALNLTQSYTFWAGLLGGTFLTMASHGTDQLMVQRLLAARNLRESQLALLSSGVVIFFQFAFFLLIGAGLWVFYGMATPPGAPHPGSLTGVGAPHLASEMWARTVSPDRLFPTFITHEMPTGAAGLLIAAILAAAMSNLSAALNSLSSTTVVDFYLRFRPRTSDRERTLISKASTALWALVLFAIAIVSLRNGGKGHVVEIGLSIAAVAYGCLLGVFLLGTLTRFATEWGAITGMITGFILNVWLWQGTFPAHLGPLTIPHIAFTWYVLIGAAVTFAIGSLASLALRKSPRPKLTPAATATVLPLLFLLSFPKGICVLHAEAQRPSAAPSPGASRPSPDSRMSVQEITLPPGSLPRGTQSPSLTTYDFSQISTLITDAIAHHQLPGAVVVIGHGGQIVFHHAYGNRKLANEPGLDGTPTPAEPMTEDTIFDMASLTKVIVTTTAIMQLYEAGKLNPDTPLDHYLPDFNPTHDPQRAQVTLRLLLTHFSGLPPDINLKDPWGLTSPDKPEGLHRALTTPLATTPGTKMVYSDINFILLGALVEKITAFPLDLYAHALIFQPLEMGHTRFLPLDQACGFYVAVGAAIALPQHIPSGSLEEDQCTGPQDWIPDEWLFTTAPTAHDDEGTPTTNPDFNHLLRGTVHDPTTRRMGGVAGHAGVFSTAHDMSLFAQALLDLYAGRPSKFPLQRRTLIMMTVPQQPGHTPFQVGQHYRADQAAQAHQSSSPTQNPGAPSSRPQGAKVGSQEAPGQPNPLLSPNYPAIPNQPLRGFGWDIDSGYSKPRGRILPLGTFGHTGFTGTSLWLDPQSDTFVLLLANAIHPHPGAPLSNLRGEVATAVALALNLYPSQAASSRPEAKGRSGETPVFSPQQQDLSSRPQRSVAERPAFWGAEAAQPNQEPGAPHLASEMWVLGAPQRLKKVSTASTVRIVQVDSTKTDPPLPPTLTGVDVLEATQEQALLDLAKQHGRNIRMATGPELRLGLLTNQTGLDRNGARTIDLLGNARLREDGVNLTTLFSPEHGIFGRQDTEHLTTETDPSTHLPVTSLYGPHDTDRRPSHTQLQNLDAVLIDLQDAGLRCFTYETVLGYFLEAAATERTQYHHNLHILVLDRPNPLGGLQVAGPTSDPGTESYINYQPIPLQHGLTLGELARYINATKHLDADLTVIPMQNWRRDQIFDQTGLPWTPPSPNLHTLTANLLYPATAMLELTNLSVGRGTPIAFEVFGAGLPNPIQKAGAPHLASEMWVSEAPRITGPTSNPGAPSSRRQGPKVGSSAEEPQPWFNPQLVADTLNARRIPGVRFDPLQLPIPEDANHYPGHGQTIPAVHILITDRQALNAPELGLELLSTLHHLYPTQFQLERSMKLIANRATMNALTRGDDPRTLAATWTQPLTDFKTRRTPFLLYP